ncbi:MAG: trypsin-like peptidase domain-containing protein [Sandaracinaceae bacterium]|nr:trypsin-like peptidase domain-containing protein [Sandaracinaceae bacterium]
MADEESGQDGGLQRLGVGPAVPLDARMARFQNQLLEHHGRQVCQVFCEKEEGASEVPLGTGFLVGSDLVLTSYHVLEGVLDGTIARWRIRFRFDRVEEDGGVRREGTSVGLLDTNAWLVDESPYAEFEAGRNGGREPTASELDFALVRLARPIGDEHGRGWIALTDSTPTLHASALVGILQHPMGHPLRVAVGTHTPCAAAARLRYHVDTQPGSSGAPVFASSHGLIAVHHFGGEGANQGIPVWLIAQRPRVLAAIDTPGARAPASRGPRASSASRGPRASRARAMRSLYPVLVEDRHLVVRDGELAMLDAWLVSPRSEPLVISGPAGTGKTTLLRQWIGRSDRQGQWIVCRVSAHEGTHVPIRFLDRLARSLADRTGHPVPVDATEFDRWDSIREMLEEFPEDAPAVLVVDGIDELAGPTADPTAIAVRLLTAPRAASLRIVLTMRRFSDSLVAGVGHVALGALDEASVLALLTASDRKGERAMTEAQAKAVLRATGSDALLVSLFHTAFLRDPDPSTWRPVDASPGELGLVAVLEWWKGEQLRREGRLDSTARHTLARVLERMADALGPVTAAELAASCGSTGDEVARLLATGASYLVIGTASSGYSLAHPRMADMFSSSGANTEWQAYCRLELERLRKTGATPSQYVLHHAVAHLCAADSARELEGLVSARWRAARAKPLRSASGFLQDMRSIVEWCQPRVRRGDVAALSLAVRASLAASASRLLCVPALAAARMVSLGLWSTHVALATVQQSVGEDEYGAAIGELLVHDTASGAIDAALGRAIERNRSIPSFSERTVAWIATKQPPRTATSLRAALRATIGRDWLLPGSMRLAKALLAPGERAALADGYVDYLHECRGSDYWATRARHDAALSPRAMGNAESAEPLLVRLLEHTANLLRSELPHLGTRLRALRAALVWAREAEHPEIRAEMEAVLSTMSRGRAGRRHALRACAIAAGVEYGMVRVFVLEQIRPHLADPGVATAARAVVPFGDATPRGLAIAAWLHTGRSPELEHELARLLGGVSDSFVRRAIEICSDNVLNAMESVVLARIERIASAEQRLEALGTLHGRLGSQVSERALRAALERHEVGSCCEDRGELSVEHRPFAVRVVNYTQRRDWQLDPGADLQSALGSTTCLQDAPFVARIFRRLIEGSCRHHYAWALTRVRIHLSADEAKRVAARDPAGSIELAAGRAHVEAAIASGASDAIWSWPVHWLLSMPDAVYRLLPVTAPATLRAVLEAALDKFDTNDDFALWPTGAWSLALLYLGWWWRGRDADAFDLLRRLLRRTQESSDASVRLPVLNLLSHCWEYEFREDTERLDICRAIYMEAIEHLICSQVISEHFVSRLVGVASYSLASPDLRETMARGRAKLEEIVRGWGTETANRNHCHHCKDQFLGSSQWSLPPAEWSEQLIASVFWLDIEYVREFVLGCMGDLLMAEPNARFTATASALSASSRLALVDALLCLRPFLHSWSTSLSPEEAQALGDAIAATCQEFAPPGNPWNVLGPDLGSTS